jgi:nucleoside 2-deoxyribosyltransferase
VRTYVAASSAEVERAESVIAHLRAVGIDVVGDWTPHVRAMRALGRRDADLSEQEASDVANECVRAIVNAETVVVLAPAAPSSGCAFEFGYACCAGKSTVLSGPHARASIFHSYADLVVDTDSAAVLAAIGIATRGIAFLAQQTKELA